MKQLFITILLILTTGLITAQNQASDPEIDEFMTRFNNKMDTVKWLCEYDDIAWWTSDSILASPKEERAKLGSQWFCFKEADLWHAAYGKFADGEYELVYHYIVDSTNYIKRIYTGIDTFTSNSFCRALINGSDLVNNFPDSAEVRFNQYIKRNADNTISLWFLPAFTENGVAVYGGEFYYLFDPYGNHLVAKSEQSYGYKGFNPNPKSEIWLDYTFTKEPTLGAIFFVWYYRYYFDKIIIDAKNYKSSVFHNDNGHYWVHAKKN